MKNKKTESPYIMRTVQSAKVQGIKIYLKRYETKPIFMMQPQEHRVLFWLVTSSAKLNRKFSNGEAARTCFAQLIEFEKSQTRITFHNDGRVLKMSQEGKWIDVTEHPDTAVW